MLTFDEIWHDSPLVRAEIKQIIAAARLPIVLADPVEGTIETTLAYIAGMTLKQGFFRDNVTIDEWNAIRDHFLGLFRIENQVAFVIDRPPSLPDDWLMEMNRWLGKGPPEVKQGHPEIELDHVVFPLLLAFYAVVYDKSPAATINGPTERFVTEFFSCMRNITTTHVEWFVKGTDPSRPDPSKIIPVTEDERIRNRIRDFKDRIDKAWMRKLINLIANVVSAHSS